MDEKKTFELVITFDGITELLMERIAAVLLWILIPFNRWVNITAWHIVPEEEEDPKALPDFKVRVGEAGDRVPFEGLPFDIWPDDLPKDYGTYSVNAPRPAALLDMRKKSAYQHLMSLCMTLGMSHHLAQNISQNSILLIEELSQENERLVKKILEANPPKPIKWEREREDTDGQD